MSDTGDGKIEQGDTGQVDTGQRYHDGNERDIVAKQEESVTESSALDDKDIDASKVQVLPGTGGPDDVGYTEVEPDDYNRSGH
jgi:hypothetical protein